MGSHEFGCSEEILSIAAMTSVQNVFIVSENDPIGEARRRAFIAEEGDHLTLLNGNLFYISLISLFSF